MRSLQHAEMPLRLASNQANSTNNPTIAADVGSRSVTYNKQVTLRPESVTEPRGESSPNVET